MRIFPTAKAYPLYLVHRLKTVVSLARYLARMVALRNVLVIQAFGIASPSALFVAVIGLAASVRTTAAMAKMWVGSYMLLLVLFLAKR
jgi:hypothetical protein